NVAPTIAITLLENMNDSFIQDMKIAIIILILVLLLSVTPSQSILWGLFGGGGGRCCGCCCCCTGGGGLFGGLGGLFGGGCGGGTSVRQEVVAAVHASILITAKGGVTNCEQLTSIGNELHAKQVQSEELHNWLNKSYEETKGHTMNQPNNKEFEKKLIRQDAKSLS
ncbi:hypothetical protein TELCIR_17647, partial [Teladorsagia circumcincta]